MNNTELRNESKEVLKTLCDILESNNVGILNVNTNSGAVCINVQTLDFTYVDLFGKLVLNQILKNPIQDTRQKLEILAVNISAYSTLVSGVTYSISNNN